MSRPPTFDHAEIRRLWATGDWTRKQLADHFGCSIYVIDYARMPSVREYARRKQMEYRVPCANGCGNLVHGRYRDGTLCNPCAALKLATSVRPDELYCSHCDQWKPDEAFPRNRREALARRGRHTTCRACSTEIRREYRKRNPEARERENRRRMERYYASREIGAANA